LTTQKLVSKGFEFDDAADAVEFYFERGWADGLPVVPPTDDTVRRFLDEAGRAPSDIVATEPTRGRVITAEKVAINAVMAGCLPEYMPVVLAAIEAMDQPKFNLHAITASTMGAAVLTVVNGPVAGRLGMNSGVNVFGPGCRPNATIGRAIRLVLTNVSGASPGELDKATLGHPGKYSFCIAEAEDVSPWSPLHVERGLDPGQSAVTVFAALSPIGSANHSGPEPEVILPSLVDAMFAAGPLQHEIIVVLCPEQIGYIRAAGWSKDQVRQFLFKMARRPASEWRRLGKASRGGIGDAADESVPAVRSPDGITLIVAGGAAGAFTAVIPIWGGAADTLSVTNEIR
jgi:hypothetical protein